MGTSLTTHLRLIKPDDVESIDVEQLNSNYDKIDEAYNKLPRGAVLRRSRSTLSGPMTNANLEAINPVTLKAGRLYKFTMDSVNTVSNADTTFQIALHRCATTDSNISVDNMKPIGLKNYSQHRHNFAAVSESATTTVIIPQEVDETFQMKVTYIRVTGSGSVSCTAMNLVLEDMGVI